jgi:hypothetical protein
MSVIDVNPTILLAGGTGVTVSSNNIVIPAGTWLFETPNSNVDSNSIGGTYLTQIRLQNTTDNTTVDGESRTVYETNVSANTFISGFLEMTGVATFASTVNVQFQAQSNFSGGTQSWGTQTGVGLYIKITKIA